ncbi:MAG TPA: head GIN domain-containing protein [Saprospiraceae bacterium]|nr:DUF2807 domain-containing protein [Saprospiraceae bacterium]MCB9269075.1 DUF2807 domain-containing protein [Lewinellaceae bacterium]HPG05500.1 head GIN domain-containing protein [Saprospiraceae bacterium]HQU52229.1 head GIN domain-containing protein [Saprospiraceae bacterium]HRV85008.1 head GIN domain-containing protein [Saprospiraceae bacterium]
MKTRTGVFLLTSLVFTSCFFDFGDRDIFGCITAQGDYIEQDLNLDDFDRIQLSIDAEVIVEQGDEQSVVVEAYESVVDNLNTDIRNGEWNIRLDHCARNIKDVVIRITVPRLDAVKVSGSGSVYSTNTFSASGMDIDISGSGKVDMAINVLSLDGQISGSGDLVLEGSAENVDYRISGSGKYHGFNLDTKNTSMDISGSGDAEVLVSELLEVRISGSGDIFYKGNPQLDVRTSGSGRVIDAN